MLVYRILKAPHLTDPKATIGSQKSPGRWNTPTHGVLYTASSPALALLETMVHFQDVPFQKLPELRLYELKVANELVRNINPVMLPVFWNTPGALDQTQNFLKDWYDNPGPYLGAGVPSAILEMSWNYLLTPSHPAFAGINVIESYPVRLDPRLWRV